MYKKYTPVRQFYAWIGFFAICIMTLHGAIIAAHYIVRLFS